jgi:hypothetical protein
MQREQRKIESALQSKGFRVDETHHRYFIYHTVDGRRTEVKTYTSRGSKGSIGQPLLGQMARQCRLPLRSFLDLVDCPLEREGYEELLHRDGVV